MCKIDSILGTKNVVQVGDSKKIYFNTFELPNKDQNNKIFKNLVDIQDFLNKNGGQTLGIIDLVRLISKANNMANDLLIMDMSSYIKFKNNYRGDDVDRYTAIIKVNITDSSSKNAKNPSNKTLIVNVSYPDINNDLTANGFITRDLPPAFLETLNDNLSNRLIIRMQERAGEYKRLQKEFQKSKATQESGIMTIKKDSVCFDQTKNQKMQAVSATAPLEKLNFTDVIIDVASGAWQKVVDGATYTYESVFNKTVEVVSFTPSPTPETPLSKYIKSTESPENGTTYTGSTSSGTVGKPISGQSSSNKASPSPSSSSRPSNTNSGPTPTPSSNPKPSPTIKTSPSNSPTPSPSQTTRVSPSASPSNSPSPTPSPSNTTGVSPSPSPSQSIRSSPSPSASPSPTSTITPTPTPSPSPSPSPTNQSFLYKSTTATVFYSILGIVEYFLR